MSRLSHCTFLVLAVCLLQTSGALGVDDDFAAARQAMIEEIQATVTETRRETGRARLVRQVYTMEIDELTTTFAAKLVYGRHQDAT